MARVNTVIVGGGPAGIATGASLHRRGVDAVVLEQGETVAPAWKRHYDRLHLHTNKAGSDLPGRPMPGDYPKYPSRDQVWSYLDDYATAEQLDVRLGAQVTSVAATNGAWTVARSDGSDFEGSNVVVATGLSRLPRIPAYPNQESYRGQILHTADYKNGAPYIGRPVLVVGFGNSAAEIALDLMEHGARSHISVRSPSVVVPRDVAGIPILTLARWLSVFPPKVADWLSKPVLAMTVGDISEVGIPAASWGPLEQVATSHKVPMIDVGTMDALKNGTIEAHPGIGRFTETGVVFSDGSAEAFDAVIFGTGYDAAVGSILDSSDGLFDGDGLPLVSGGVTARPGLYFCGFREPPTGRLREIGIEAERLGELIAGGTVAT